MHCPVQVVMLRFYDVCPVFTSIVVLNLCFAPGLTSARLPGAWVDAGTPGVNDFTDKSIEGSKQALHAFTMR
eukprot:354622-Rhodomonas_salina.1